MYGIISDTHCHNWTMFGYTEDDGVNNRLRIILNNIKNSGNEVLKNGGKWLFHAGDIFHIRGSVTPSVLNPTLATFKSLVDKGLNIVLVCGNHDAEFRDANDLGSAVDAFRAIGCQVVNDEPKCFYVSENEAVLCVPWQATKQKFLATLEKIEVPNISFDVVCHCPLDGVFSHISGSSAVDPHDVKKVFENTLFKRIFAGHLHRYEKICDFAWSVGAIAHHNWGDVGAQAGFMLVSDSEAIHVDTLAPKFIELTTETLEHGLDLIDGHYVRATLQLSEKEVKEVRALLEKKGAKGVTIINRLPEVLRNDRLDVKREGDLPEINDLLSKYVDTHCVKDLAPDVKQRAFEILREAENVL